MRVQGKTTADKDHETLAACCQSSRQGPLLDIDKLRFVTSKWVIHLVPLSCFAAVFCNATDKQCIMSYFLVVSRTHGETVLTQYQRLREEQLLFDIVLVADGTEFPAHRSLLACSSDYFRVLFKDYTRESKASVIHLQVVSSTGLHHVLDFIYTSWLSLSPETLEDTLEAAGYLQVTEAIGLCGQYITNNLSLENCCFFANVASRFGLRDALSAANR
ncbi:UNVERIFIED_CONTAM: hypothetical protein FKN15_024714 [Acipenser sinensis]